MNEKKAHYLRFISTMDQKRAEVRDQIRVAYENDRLEGMVDDILAIAEGEAMLIDRKFASIIAYWSMIPMMEFWTECCVEDGQLEKP